MTTSHHDEHAHGSDMKAAFLGLVLGAVALLVILSTIVYLTSQRYAHEQPAAQATH